MEIQGFLYYTASKSKEHRRVGEFFVFILWVRSRVLVHYGKGHMTYAGVADTQSLSAGHKQHHSIVLPCQNLDKARRNFPINRAQHRNDIWCVCLCAVIVYHPKYWLPIMHTKKTERDRPERKREREWERRREKERESFSKILSMNVLCLVINKHYLAEICFSTNLHRFEW